MVPYDNSKSCSSISELASSAAEQVQNAWEISNSAFSTPLVIAKTSIKARIITAYEFFNTYTNRKLKKPVNVKKKYVANSRINDLDRLFDITKCRCDITSCTFDSDVCKPGCQVRNWGVAIWLIKNVQSYTHFFSMHSESIVLIRACLCTVQV